MSVILNKILQQWDSVRHFSHATVINTPAALYLSLCLSSEARKTKVSFPCACLAKVGFYRISSRFTAVKSRYINRRSRDTTKFDKYRSDRSPPHVSQSTFSFSCKKRCDWLRGIHFHAKITHFQELWRCKVKQKILQSEAFSSGHTKIVDFAHFYWFGQFLLISATHRPNPLISSAHNRGRPQCAGATWYSLLLNRRHVSSIRQDNLWKFFIVIAQPIFLKLSELHWIGYLS